MERARTPPVDMYETKNEVGERQRNDETREAGHYRQERWFGKFERAFSLPIPVETGQVKATYRVDSAEPPAPPGAVPDTQTGENTTWRR